MYIEHDTRKQTLSNTCLSICPSVWPFIRSFVHSFIRLFTHSFIHSSLFLCHRLVMYIERDTRKQTLGKSDMQHLEYLSRCLELLIATLVDMVPQMSSKYM